MSQNSNRFSAAWSNIGYYYQLRCALLLLMKSPKDSQISLESLDDIVFERDGTPEELVQTKHHINSTASLIDTSTDIWRTLRVWSTEISEGRFNPSNVTLTLITTAKAQDDSAASKLRPKESGMRNAEEALAILCRIASEDTGQTNKPGYDAFLQISEEKQKQLVESIRIIDEFPSINDLKRELESQLKLVVPDKFKEPLLKRLEGWWFDRSIKHLTRQLTGPILFKELNSEIWDLQKQFEEDNLPIDFLQAVAPHASQLPPQQQVFIEQLKLIAVIDQRINLAISDYYRAFEQRSRWVREDLLLGNELTEYEDKLVREWRELFYIMQEDLRASPSEDDMKERGRTLYSDIILGKNIPIRPRVSEPYIMRGSYHILANKREVGWHLQFIDRLQRLLSPEQGAQ